MPEFLHQACLGWGVGACPSLSSWILHSAALISLKLISSLYTMRPQVINHRRWEQSAPILHISREVFCCAAFLVCDKASEVARLLFMVNSVWSTSHVLMWQTRGHCSRTHWPFFFLLLSTNRMESTDDFICFELKHSSAWNEKNHRVLTSVIFVTGKYNFFPSQSCLVLFKSYKSFLVCS